MNDAKLYFDTAHVFAAADAVSEYTLDVKAIAEVGRGSQLFVNVVVTTVASAYTAGANSFKASKFDIYLCTNATTYPTSGDRIQALSVNDLHAITDSTVRGRLLSKGLKVKVPLPSLNLLSHVGLWYDVGTAVTLVAITSFLTLD